MTESVKLVVVIPLGPASILDYVKDTIQSVTHYTASNTRVIIIDDSGENLSNNLESCYPDLIIINTPGNSGTYGGLYWWLSSAFVYALEKFDFEVILKLDTDALIVGQKPEIDAFRLFRADQKVGIIGSYKVDCNGVPRDFHWWANEIVYEVTDWSRILRHPMRYLLFRRVLLDALANGYNLGEHCQGGAYFVSAECVRRLAQSKLLLRKEFRSIQIGEDPFFGLLVRSVGMDLGDLATGSLPMGISWQGLPCSPDNLLKRGKKVIHSVRFWEDMGEDEIRRFFRELRTA